MQPKKAIFITGAGSGIGRAVAELFFARGWFVGLSDIDLAGMAETEALLPGGFKFAQPLDVRDRGAWDKALATFAVAAGSRIDVVFNNAGIAFGGPFAQLATADLDRLLDVNVRGVAYGAQAAYPHLKRTAPGSCLLNAASASALYGTAGLAAYSASKFAVRALTEALDREWRDDGIRVRSLMPSFIDTPLLAGPIDDDSGQTRRERVLAAGLEFTPVETVAEAAWAAVHGERLHTLVGKTARRLALLSRWAPGAVRKRAPLLTR